jgi:hypothetical protein
MSKCSWCGCYTENSSDKFEENFCSLKCLDEYASRGYRLTEKTGCFVATAVYGSYDHDVVFDLRKFRDNWLLNRKWGTRFVTLYYRYSPTWANIIRKSTSLKYFVRVLLIKPLHYIVTLFRLHLLRK